MKPRDIEAQYLRAIKKALPCDSAQKKRYIAGLRDSIQPYLSEHPDATLEDLYTSIGSPESIAESFMAGLDPKQLSHRLSAKRRIAIGVISIVAVLAIFIGVVAIAFADDLHSYLNGYVVEIIEESQPVVEPLSSPLTEY